MRQQVKLQVNGAGFHCASDEMTAQSSLPTIRVLSWEARKITRPPEQSAAVVSHSFRLYCYSAALVVTGCILTAAIPIHLAVGPFGSLIMGYFFGTMFGQGTLAAAWAALGPSPRVWRMPLSLLWMFLIVAAVALHLREEALDELEILL